MSDKIITEMEAVAVEKKQRPKVIRWAIITLSAIVASAVISPALFGGVFGWWGPLIVSQMLGMVAFVSFIIFSIQLIRWVVSFVNVQKIVKEIMKAHAKR